MLRLNRRSTISNLISSSIGPVSELWLSSSRTNSTSSTQTGRRSWSRPTSISGSNTSNLVDSLPHPKVTWTSWWRTSSTTSLARQSCKEPTKAQASNFLISNANKLSIAWWWLCSLTAIARATNSSANLSNAPAPSRRLRSTSQSSETQCTSTVRRPKTGISPSPLNPSCLPHSPYLMKA